MWPLTCLSRYILSKILRTKTTHWHIFMHYANIYLAGPASSVGCASAWYVDSYGSILWSGNILLWRVLHPFQQYFSHFEMIEGWKWKALCNEAPFRFGKNLASSIIRTRNHMIWSQVPIKDCNGNFFISSGLVTEFCNQWSSIKDKFEKLQRGVLLANLSEANSLSVSGSTLFAYGCLSENLGSLR